MNMVQKYYVILILFLSVLYVFAYGTSSELKIQEKLKPTNEVVYRTPSSISSNKDEKPQKDINLKYETSTSTDISTTIETIKSESESITSDEKYTSSIKDETSHTDINSKYDTTTPESKSITSDGKYTPSIKDAIFHTDINSKYETLTTIETTTPESKSTTSDGKYTPSIKDETSHTDINLKYETSPMDFSRISELESTTSSEEYTTSTEKKEFSLKAIYKDFTSSIKDETFQTHMNFKDKTSTDFSKTIETSTLESESIKSNGKYSSLIKDEISLIDINSKYDTSFETSSEEYSTSTEKIELSPRTIKDETSQTDEISTDFPETTSDETDFTTTEMSSTITTTETTTIDICETAEITEIISTPSPFSLNITWTNSVNAEYCKFIYEIQLSKEIFYNTTSDSFIFIYNLNACEYYEGKISILLDGKTIHSEKFYNATSEAADPVEQLKYETTETEFVISWIPSIRTKSCIKYYKWNYFLDGKLIDEKNQTLTNVKIPQPDGCLNNTFLVLAVINEFFISSSQKTTYTDIKVNDPPNFKNANMSATSAITIWTYEKICKPQSFLVKFISDKENYTTVDIHLEEKNTIIAEVNGLLAFTNYSFQGAIKNEMGISEWSEMSPIFQTNSTEPDAPENLNIIQIQNGSLYITWDKPNKWNGIEECYILQIKYNKLNYKPVPGCDVNNHEDITREVEYNVNKYIYTDFIEPASSYSISISAKSSGLIGPSVQKDIDTSEADPDEPEEILTTFIENSIKNKYDVTLHVKWRTPCRVNGIARQYNIQLITCDTSSNKYTVKTYYPSELYYEESFKNILPDTCYKFVVQLHLQSKYSEKQLNVTSPAGGICLLYLFIFY